MRHSANLKIRALNARSIYQHNITGHRTPARHRRAVRSHGRTSGFEKRCFQLFGPISKRVAGGHDVMSFFATPLGQKIGAGLAGIGSIGAMAAAWLPQTIYLDAFREVVQHYKHGFPLPLTKELEDRANRVLQDFTKLSEAKKASIRFFHVSRLEPWHAGTPESGYGAIIGLPINFTFRSVKDVQTREMKLFTGRSIEWDTPAGEVFKKSMIMSDEAQRFAIAQQIYLTNTSEVTVRALAACGAALNTFIISKLVNRRIPRQTPFAGRCIVYAGVSLVCIIGYLAINDMARYKYERDSINVVAKLGPDYRQGAIEYFEKRIVQNKALRILLGDKGTSMFTVKGNVSTWLRTPHMPLSICLDQAKRAKKNMEEICDVCEEISGTKSSKKANNKE
ncbi:transmembrane protein-like [Tropilaelaps mercedesae]|uniref:Transmembrane protein-like n=1 Tax=Tropilaelaps mercedesae TaxID=418985 RepID=A0A1V9XQP2_9ACAR|nr:transmembrane protein-like [Tropilaelaps mercedesae]